MSRINELREQLSLFDEAYEQGKPLISDTEYEKMYSELRELEAKTGDINPESPTQMIPFIKVDGLETVKHTIPMLSLDKTNNYDGLRKWYSVKEEVLIQPKIDGLTVVLRYNNGHLIDAITRGNGLEGERVLHTISTVKNLPKTIPFTGYLEVRGEVYIPYDEFERINNGEYSNPRAMAAGMVRRHDSSQVQGLRTAIFDLIAAEGQEFTTDYDQMFFLSKQGFEVVNTARTDYLDRVIQICMEYQEVLRNKLNYPIDGMVIKYDSLELRKKLGATSKSPRWSIAFKFPSLEEFTILREIVWQVGKSGQITPVAVFDPIEIDGVTINRATLHNKQFILDQDIRIGDRIVVARANDVIPKVVRAVVEARTQELVLPEIPTKCPSCGEDIWIQPDVPHITCLNPFCRDQIIEKIIHFCSRDAMDIEGMGEVNVRTLFDLGFIQNPADLYSLNNKAEEIEKIEGFGQTKINKILEGIEKSKNLPLSRLLYALAIPGVGKTTALALAPKYRTLDNLANASKEELANVEGVGSVTAQGIWFYFLNPQTKDMLQRFVEAGVNTEEMITETKETLTGKTFVLTGTMSRPRSEIETLIKQNGGKVAGSVSSKTSFLVAAPGETGTTKYQKAQQLGIPIISESQLMEMLG